MRAEIYVLSYQRPELLACALAGVCGFNGNGDDGRWTTDDRPSPVAHSPSSMVHGPSSIHIIDDGSSDPRVHALLARYTEAGLIESVDIQPHGGVGRIRRRMIDRFLESGADQLIQVEGDMIVAPGGVEMLSRSWAVLRAAGHRTGILNSHVHHWCHRVLEYKTIGICRIAVARSGSEPFWTSDRETLAANLDALPAERPDLVPFLQRCGCTSLMQPEIQVQHLGAGRQSIYYPDFHWSHVVYHNDNERLGDGGPLRKPYPFLSYDFEAWQRTYPQCFREAYEAFRMNTPVQLPEFPE